VSFEVRQGKDARHTSVQWAALGSVCALVWCCSCSHPPVLKTWTAMLDYLGMSVSAVSFEGL
jgi:predicted metal-binding transcription factor (methanogenesis marker protein 9)